MAQPAAEGGGRAPPRRARILEKTSASQNAPKRPPVRSPASSAAFLCAYAVLNSVRATGLPARIVPATRGYGRVIFRPWWQRGASDSAHARCVRLVDNYPEACERGARPPTSPCLAGRARSWGLLRTHDAVVDAVVQARHAREDGWPQLQHIVQQLCHVAPGGPARAGLQRPRTGVLGPTGRASASTYRVYRAM